MTARPSGDAGATAITCPSCGGGVEVADLPAAGQTSMECRYCGTAILLPRDGLADLFAAVGARRAWSPMPVPVRPARQGRRWVPVVAVVVFVVATGGVVVAAALAASGAKHPTSSRSTRAATPTGPAAFATVERTFGGLGIGTGLTQDPNAVAVDSTGDIWVADRQDGRLQEFGADGTYRRTVTVPRDRNDTSDVQDLAADGQGHVYLVTGENILRYSAASGALTRTFQGVRPSGTYTGVLVDAAGTVYGVHVSASEDTLIKLDGAGHVLARWSQFVQRAEKKDPAQNLDLTVDGTGAVLVASAYTGEVYLFDPKGAFVDKFDGRGSAPEQLGRIEHIAVDGRGRVYVGDGGYGIRQFDHTGHPLGGLKIDYHLGTVTALAADHDELYAVTSKGLVVTLKLKPPAS